MILIFLGAPGSGKGTVASRLVETDGFKHVSTGNIFRALGQKDTPLAAKIKTIVDGGNLIDDDTTFEVLVDGLKAFDLQNQNLILDGYPRNLNQAQHLAAYFAEQKITNYKVILFEITEDKIIERLTGRLLCHACQRTFHISDLTPDADGNYYCESDVKEKLVRREDDKLENVQTRLHIYREQTSPLIAFYEDQEKLIRIDSDRARDLIAKDVLRYV